MDESITCSNWKHNRT